MKLFKKLLVACLTATIIIGSFHAGKICVAATDPQQAESEAEKFSINIRTARKYLEQQLQPDLNEFEKLLVNSVENLKKSRTEITTKSSSTVTKTSNPAFAQFFEIRKKLEQSRRNKLGRLFLKKLLEIHKIFDKETINRQSLADLINIEYTYPSRNLVIKTNKESTYNYSYTHKCFGIPTEDGSGMPNLRKIINSLFKDHGILTIVLQEHIIHLMGVEKNLEYFWVMCNDHIECWKADFLEDMCRDCKVLDVYYMEKLEK